MGMDPKIREVCKISKKCHLPGNDAQGFFQNENWDMDLFQNSKQLAQCVFFRKNGEKAFVRTSFGGFLK